MDRLLFDVLNRIADNLFLIREAVECLQPKPPEDNGDDEEEPDNAGKEPDNAGMTFYECDSFCRTCKHMNIRGWDFPCNDCKHVTAKKLMDRYTPRGGQHGETD